jgi:hypothetical protein
MPMNITICAIAFATLASMAILSCFRSLATWVEFAFSFSSRRTALSAGLLSANAMRSKRLNALMMAALGIRSQTRLWFRSQH